MKTRITNLLTATIWLLITAVWLPTFWTLAQLPWTLNEQREASALLRYVDHDIGTIHYSWAQTYYAKPCSNPKKGSWLTCEYEEEKAELDSRRYTISTGGSFIPFIVFTLICIALQYLLIGKVTLRFIKGKNDEDP